MKHTQKRLFSLLLSLMLLAALPAVLAAEAPMELTLEQLKEYNGQDGRRAYVAVDGVVYDMTDSLPWKDGKHNGFEAGNDLTDAIKNVSPHGVMKLDKVPKVGTLVAAPLTLTLEQLKEFDGKDGRRAYVAVDGVVYDMTDSLPWKDGKHNGFEAGNDLTDAIKNVSPHGVMKLDKVPKVGTLIDASTPPAPPDTKEGGAAPAAEEAAGEQAKGGAAAALPAVKGNQIKPYALMGWGMVFLAAVAVSPYVLRVINAHTVKSKSKRFIKCLQRLRKVHKPAGLLLAVVGPIHAYLALGGKLRLHTGSLLYFSFLVTVVLGGSYYKTRNKKLLMVHRAMVVVSALLLVLHLVKPWLLG